MIYLYNISLKYENRKMFYFQISSIVIINTLGLIYYILTKNLIIIILISVYICILLCLLIYQILKNRNSYNIINTNHLNFFDQSLITESFFEYNENPLDQDISTNL